MKRVLTFIAAALALSLAHGASAQSKKPSRAAEPEAETAQVLRPTQLDVVPRVILGTADCEFKQSVQVVPAPGMPGHFHVHHGRTRYFMVPLETSTGAVRLEDYKQGVAWVQIPTKSMLLNHKKGQRLIDNCQTEAQRFEEQNDERERQAEAAKRPSANVTTLAAAAAVTAAATTSAAAQQIKLRILGTTDIHVNLLSFDYYQDQPTEAFGLVRTATLIHAARAEAPNNLLLDNGDLIQGSPLGDFVAKVKPLQPGQVHPVYKLMNALRYDAANIGNHEFNFGLPYLRQVLAGAAFPYVNSNLVQEPNKAQPVVRADSGQNAAGQNLTPAFVPYVLLDRVFKDETGQAQKLRVGVIGFTPPQVMQWDRQNLLGQLAARDIDQTAREWVPRMKAAGADIIIAVPHSGFERGETVFFAENAVAKLAEVPGIDAILFGHSHGQFPSRSFISHPKVDLQRGTINGIAAAMPGAWGSHLAVIDLVLDKTAAGWKASSGTAQLRAIYDRDKRQTLAEPDAALAALIQEEHEGTRAYLRSQVATSSAPIHSYFAQVADDPSVQLVSQAQLAYGRKALKGTPYEALPLLSAAAPFKTGGRQGAGYYTDIPAGPVAIRNVADLYVYPNTVKVVRLTGVQVRQWLEMSAGAFNRIDPAGAPEQELINGSFPSFNFDTLDGLSYRIDVTQPARYDRNGKLVAPEAQRIKDLSHAGQPLRDDALFAVVTNNYRASGGGNFPGLDGSTTVLDAPDENREALVQYLKDSVRVDPSADGNWSIVPVPGVTLRFSSGAGGIKHLPANPRIGLLKDNGDGSAVYQLKP